MGDKKWIMMGWGKPGRKKVPADRKIGSNSYSFRATKEEVDMITEAAKTLAEFTGRSPSPGKAALAVAKIGAQQILEGEK